jgi:predicted molibdopterin-dependent oxidoreductase YjgC
MPSMEELAGLELLVVQDSFLSPQAAQLAHVVLPAASLAEVSGTLTNLESRSQHFEPVIPPVGESRPDWWIACRLAQEMGLEGYRFEKAAEVWAAWEDARDPKQPATISNPQPSISNLQFSSSNQQFPFTLLVERNQFSYRGSALTSRVHGMAQYKWDEGVVMLNPADAAALDLRDGESVRVTSEFGSDTLIVHTSMDISEKVAFTSINAASGSALFPGKLPAVKAYAVKFETGVKAYD